jgi:hypothetical protein
MHLVDKQDALAQLALKTNAGEHVDNRLFVAIRNSQALYQLQFKDRDSFLSLIWQESDPSRLLTPKGQPRTLKEVGLRLRGWRDFSELAGDLNMPRSEHHPEWFERCARIDSAFDYSRFGCLALVHPTDGERKQTPCGSFYIYDGVHRTLVLTKQLLAGESEFQPLGALLILPRP